MGGGTVGGPERRKERGGGEDQRGSLAQPGACVGESKIPELPREAEDPTLQLLLATLLGTVAVPTLYFLPPPQRPSMDKA